MCFSIVRVLRIPVVGLLVLTCGSALDAGPKGKPAYSTDQGLVVHEWGTFSTFSGSNGTNLKFYPYDNDLPDFVHGYQRKYSKQGPQGGTISLETPVLYFYAKDAVTASVQVEFPKGTITEWYPHAARTKSKLVWRNIDVLPKEKVRLQSESKDSRYYEARETDASPLTIAMTRDGAATTEAEKFLFYRGVGSFDMPLSVRARADGKLIVTWKGKEPEGEMILVQVRGGKVRFRPFQLDSKLSDGARAEVEVPGSDGTVEQLSQALVERLRSQGLYEKEARAMVATWRSAWFGEEGTRVLYILSERLTNDLLPLEVSPKPASLIRVLVGRHDFLTPVREKQIDSWVKTLKRPNSQDDAVGRAAAKAIEQLGRYRGAAWQQAEARLNSRR